MNCLQSLQISVECQITRAKQHRWFARRVIWTYLFVWKHLVTAFALVALALVKQALTSSCFAWVLLVGIPVILASLLVWGRLKLYSVYLPIFPLSQLASWPSFSSVSKCLSSGYPAQQIPGLAAKAGTAHRCTSNWCPISWCQAKCLCLYLTYFLAPFWNRFLSWS